MLNTVACRPAARGRCAAEESPDGAAEKSGGAPAAAESERLVQQFLALINQTAAREYEATRGAAGEEGEAAQGQ